MDTLEKLLENQKKQNEVNENIIKVQQEQIKNYQEMVRLFERFINQKEPND